MKTKLYWLGGVLTVLALVATFFAPSPALLSPMASTTPANISNLESNNYLILGFAPYWNLKKLSPDSLTSITHLAYFSLHLKGDGTLYTHVNRREEDPGYTNYKRLLNQSIDTANKPLILTFMPESQAALTSLLSSPTSRARAVQTILDKFAESNAYGINFDFEPLGDSSPILRSNYTALVQEVSAQLKSRAQLSISLYASAASKPRIWDLTALSPLVHYFVVMTYDYTLPGSPVSGPNSPLRGAGTLFEHDITQNIAQISRLVPPRQLLLGIPFYGYEWDTPTSTKYAPTDSRGSVASLERIQTMLDNQTLELLWDRNSLTPYGISSSSGQTTQIYFENATSLKLKLDFVRAANLGGIAIWALGYEGNNSWVWPTIRSLNN